MDRDDRSLASGPDVLARARRLTANQLVPGLRLQARLAGAAVTGHRNRSHREFPFTAAHLTNYRQTVLEIRPEFIVVLTDLHSDLLAGVVRACQSAFGGVELLVVRVRPRRIGLPADTPRVRYVQLERACELSRVLWRDRPAKVVIEFVSQGRIKGGVLSQALFAIDDGGVYVIHQLEPSGDPEPRFGQVELAQVLTEDEERQHSAAEVEVRRESVVIRKRGRHVFKLRDDQLADGRFARRLGPGWGREITRLPEREFVSRASVEVNRPEYLVRFQSTMTVRPRYLREYRDVVCGPRQTVVRGTVAMPISFHHPGRKRQHLRDQVFVDLDVDRLVEPDPTLELPGTYFHLVSEFPGHFGHVMTEDLGRIWGWYLAKQLDPDCKLLLGVAPGKTAPEPFQQVLLEALGVDRSDVVCIDQPVRVARLIGAGPQFHNRRFVDPDLAVTWDRIRQSLQPEPDPSSPERVFVSRPPGGRRCRNGPELEQRFVAEGFTLARPETLSLPEQVRLFSNADVVAGYGGSGMFGMIYGRRPGRRIVLSATTYTASNEYLIASVKGDNYLHLWCTPEVEHPASGWSKQAFLSDYTFDFERDWAQVAAFLADG